MKRFKVRAIAIATLASVATLVAACSGGTTPGDTGPGPLPTTSVTLKFSWWGNPTRAATTQKVIENFQKKYPYIHVEGEPGDIANYFTQRATEIAASDAPDIMTLGGAYPLSYASKGALLDLGAVKADLDTSVFSTSLLGASTYKNKVYGVPTGGNFISVIANPAVFQAANVALPDDTKWTWEDFVNVANQVTKGSPAGTFGAEERSVDLIGAYAAQRNTPLYDQDGKLTVTAATLSAFWTMEKSLLDGGGMPSASETQEIIKANPDQTLMGRGKSGMIFAYTNQLSAYEKASGKQLKLLQIPGESEYARRGMTLLPSQYYAIYSGTKFPRQAATFVNYLVNDPEAGKLILTDRGLPASPKVLEAIAPLLPDPDQRSAQFVGQVAKLGAPPSAPSPANSSGQNDITYTIDAKVLFGQLTPSAAAQSWLDQMKASMAGS